MVSFFEKSQNGKQFNGQREGFPIKISEAQENKKSREDKWIETEGQLAVDVFQTENDLVIQSTVAGLRSNDLDIAIEDDKVTIRGRRERPTQDEKINYFYQECYWGPFSREIILPVEIDPTRAAALFKEGVLVIRMPKISREKKRKIIVKA